MIHNTDKGYRIPGQNLEKVSHNTVLKCLEPNIKTFLWKLVDLLNNMFTLCFLYCILNGSEINITIIIKPLRGQGIGFCWVLANSNMSLIQCIHFWGGGLVGHMQNSYHNSEGNALIFKSIGVSQNCFEKFKLLKVPLQSSTSDCSIMTVKKACNILTLVRRMSLWSGES